MAAKAKTKEVSMEEALWKSADKLRGSVEPSEYKHVVLSLFFLKFASDKFEAQRARIIADGMEKFLDTIAFYTKDNVFYLPQESRWTYIMENAKQDDIALKIDTVKLASLLDEINKIDTTTLLQREKGKANFIRLKRL